MIKTALISVFDKENILDLATSLQNNGVEIISTGGTFKYLKENGIKVVEISEVTGFEEILDGRVKTLHPTIHSGILAIRDNKEHMATIKAKGIKPIDMVVVNLYPFFDKVTQNISFQEKVEFIDIGGPTMLRAAAKNFKDVIVLSDTSDYKNIISKMDAKQEVEFETRKHLAGKVFNLISAYDAAISNFLLGEDSYSDYLSLSYKKQMDLRYGENPHQSAAYYVSTAGSGAMKDFKQLNGKELSYNNIKDMDIAWKVVCEFDETACCALKHNTPCGVATGSSLLDTYKKAYECDPMSIFGGIVAFNRKVDSETAKELVKIFLEVVIAPEFDAAALEILKGKKNLRIIVCSSKAEDKLQMVKVDGGILLQSSDQKLIDEIKVVTENRPSESELKDLIFAMKVVKYVKSNAIVIVKDGVTKGIGAGQVNRIWAAQQALERSVDGTIMASDAFFPFGDVVELAAKYKITSIIQPGGSIKDAQSIDACNKNGISMVFTGTRHFKH
ncbi:bifunctional phosphoribosylaminoimidazolecarboxamide formyltransferase/IMP cyclohydrolase [Clostridium bowmanii]|uniref:bifunctional phosphoribosylaminoimidazolecarboxamide formyltransferase/IMP cyclohydrolase n=1 Tax=Clostridium bowmanii TaxID=132925 RepID=UPI001C0BB6B8|nr:bifunctional phosphoribosylaminoimidazolecarboxamide formyltransferase/IMP cyclohydrolase [Clostridium bowmanii]MBU3192016.1 bifunctional phosphoribosylaminoimidazolecarboxamide formyltransferase/IMP cyclohydrolase [Clostridium bowmanii]MCA1076310.1 bifunctional phosphoribosylaminoimidazolecarboxamide formyltransferase/IMP cyclohydrolase [Clostridium bowmanii]